MDCEVHRLNLDISENREFPSCTRTHPFLTRHTTLGRAVTKFWIEENYHYKETASI